VANTLNIGMIGYGFMGRAHSNAYHRVNQFFDVDYRPVLKAVAARSRDKAEAFASRWGWGRTIHNAPSAVAFGDTLRFCSLVELRTRSWSLCSSDPCSVIQYGIRGFSRRAWIRLRLIQ